MADFNEFDEQGSVPAPETGSIISHAFEMYKGIFLYALLAMGIYIVGSWLIQMLSGFDSMTFVDEVKDSGGYSSVDYFAVPGLSTYYGLSGLFGILISPLYVGLIYIINKYNNKEQIQAGDLFIGYRQNLVNILLYSLIVNIILGIATVLCILPVLFVFPLFLIGYPVLLFENASVGDAIRKSYNIAKDNYWTFFGAGVLGILISISGIILCFVGVLATAFFTTAVMYSTYVAFQGKPRPLLKP